MKYSLPLITLVFSALPTTLWADCLSGEEVAQNTDVVLYAQTSYVNKQPSIWQIGGNNPFSKSNIYNNFGINLKGDCAIIDNRLDLNFSLYGLTYRPFHANSDFEEDRSHSRALIDRLSVIYNVSDSVQLEAGKFSQKAGLFFLRSPADLRNSYYAGFKSTRLYDPLMEPAFQESPWQVKLSEDTQDYSLSFSVVPKLADAGKRHLASGDWSANVRSNSREDYLLNYTDHRFEQHLPAVSLLLGETRSVAISDSYNLTPQLVINAEAAYHTEQQWRHFSPENAAMVEEFEFPSSLYSTEDKEGVEVAVGGQYATDNFNLFGLEYYYQSEGYSRAEWRKQTDFIQSLNSRTGFFFVDDIFDSYKYLMASEINNTANKNMLQGRHYLNAWSSIQMDNQSTLQPYVVFNLVDHSSVLGINYNTPLSFIDDQLEGYTGAFMSTGSSDSEFALYGDMFGVYLGLKYYM
ncbi:hypothetical protein SAMN04487787_102214 [Kosakonia sacchari]|nr:hypothetical protein SAMN04487787_102214 [Kosakonia sacchari]